MRSTVTHGTVVPEEHRLDDENGGGKQPSGKRGLVSMRLWRLYALVYQGPSIYALIHPVRMPPCDRKPRADTCMRIHV